MVHCELKKCTVLIWQLGRDFILLYFSMPDRTVNENEVKCYPNNLKFLRRLLQTHSLKDNDADELSENLCRALDIIINRPNITVGELQTMK